MIFTLHHINQITSLEKSLQEDYEKNEYIRNCFKVINESLVKYFGNNYLFHRPYFIEEGTYFQPLPLNDIKHKQNKTTLSYIELLEKKIDNSADKSFTDIILEEHFQGLLLYKGRTPGKIGNLIIHDLQPPSVSNIASLAKKLKRTASTIELLFKKYELLSHEIPGDFYAYFIRPFADHKLYNGVILLMLKKALAESEFIEIGNLWTKILSETALLKVEQLARASEQENIFEEQTHTWNNEITSIARHLDVACSRYHMNNTTSSHDTYTSIEYAFLKTKKLRDINAFNLFLMKTKGIKSWEELYKTGCHISDEHLFSELQVKPVSIKTALLDSINTLLSLIKSLEKINSEKAESRIHVLSELEKYVQKLPDLKIKTIAVGLNIIFLDLLKNALLHGDMEHPKIDVKIKQDNTSLYIHFINNSSLSKEIVDFINEGKPCKNKSLERKGGIRTIKRILNSSLINESSMKWMLKANDPSIPHDTNIMLIIPKSDVL